MGSDRYGGGKRAGGKPSYSFICHGFDTFSDASYACWDVQRSFYKLLEVRFGVKVLGNVMPLVPPGKVKHDRELWDVAVEAIEQGS